MIFFFFKELIENGISDGVVISQQSQQMQQQVQQTQTPPAPTNIDTNLQQQNQPPVVVAPPQIDVFGNPVQQSQPQIAAPNNVQVQSVPSAFANNAPMPITDTPPSNNPKPI